MCSDLTSAAKSKVPHVKTTGNEDSGVDSDLRERLDNLRKVLPRLV